MQPFGGWRPALRGPGRLQELQRLRSRLKGGARGARASWAIASENILVLFREVDAAIKNCDKKALDRLAFQG